MFDIKNYAKKLIFLLVGARFWNDCASIANCFDTAAIRNKLK